MSYFIEKKVNIPYEAAVERITEELKKVGFGILTEIDVKATLKKKLDADFRNYKILGACNPPFAYQALKAEKNIGILLPCNVIVQEINPGSSEVAVMDPAVAMAAVDNPELGELAVKVRALLVQALKNI